MRGRSEREAIGCRVNDDGSKDEEEEVEGVGVWWWWFGSIIMVGESL